jgi:hypothetical protein
MELSPLFTFSSYVRLTLYGRSATSKLQTKWLSVCVILPALEHPYPSTSYQLLRVGVNVNRPQLNIRFLMNLFSEWGPLSESAV